MSEKVTVTIGPDGQVNIEVSGAKGGSCKELTAPLEKALGSVESTQKKPEFFSQESQQQRSFE